MARCNAERHSSKDSGIPVLALYILTLGLSAACTGLFAHQVLAGLGFVPVFRAGVYLAFGAASLYLTIQFAYMLLIRVYKPTKDAAPLFLECLSHLSALVFLPAILRLPMPWPHPMLEKVAPLVFLSVFVALHGFFKLTSFFAAIRGIPAPRGGALGWLVCTALCAAGAYAGVTNWVGIVEGIRPASDAKAEYHRAGGQYAMARAVTEGADVRFDLSQMPGQGLTFLWAADADQAPGERIHVTFAIQGRHSAHITREVRLSSSGWNALRIAPDEMPDGATSCKAHWNAGEAPKWQRFSMLSPVVTSTRSLWMAGPMPCSTGVSAGKPNIVVLVIDGLPASRSMPLRHAGSRPWYL